MLLPVSVIVWLSSAPVYFFIALFIPIVGNKTFFFVFFNFIVFFFLFSLLN